MFNMIKSGWSEQTFAGAIADAREAMLVHDEIDIDTHIFKYSWAPCSVLPEKEFEHLLKPQTVNLLDLIPIQTEVDGESVHYFFDNLVAIKETGSPVVLCSKTNKLFIKDGHHRIVAALIAGKRELEVQFAIVDTIDI